MRQLAYQAARLTGTLSRRLGRGGGTSLPGMVLLKLRPNAPAELTEGYPHGVTTVSATNGKTTTARLIGGVMEASGWTVVANSAGANLLTGVTTALLDAPDAPDAALFEVDEAALPAVARQTKPSVVLLMNLFRDQLDRFGELESLVDLWRDMIAELDPGTVLIINADDPGLAGLGIDRPNVVWFGIDDPAAGRSAMAHAADSTHCPRCDEPLSYSLITIGHLGHWSCESCGLTRPRPEVTAQHVDLRGIRGQTVTMATPAGPIEARLSLPGLHNAYNAVAATAACVSLDIEPGRIVAGLGATDAAFGRAEMLEIDGRSVVLLLAKNPAGANENLRTVLLEAGSPNVLVLLNDRTADGQDVSWIWDVDYEELFERLDDQVTLGGTRAYDLALRFRYGGVEADDMHVNPDIAEAFDYALAATEPGEVLFVLPTYTAMLDLRAVLVERDMAHAFWEDA